MLKWILNKGLRFQIILILVLVLSVPAAVLTWSVLVPSNMRTVVRTMQEDRLKNLLSYIDDNLDKAKIASLDQSQAEASGIEADINSKLGSLAKAVSGTNIGIYLTADKQAYIFGRQYNNEHPAKSKGIPENEDEQGLNERLNGIVQSRSDDADYLSYRNREIIRCYHPIIYGDKVVAVTWAESILPPELHHDRNVLIYVVFLGPLGFIAGFILMIAIVKNMNSNTYKIRKGLETMSGDLSYRLEPMGGDLGKITESINTMADSLEKKEKLEEHLKRAEKLASLGQMISGVAHEIRNPLSIIRGTVQLMEKNFKHVEGLNEYVKIVKEQSDRENSVIQELLDYARPSKQILMEMDINLLIKGVLSFTNKYIQDKHIILKLELQDNLPKLLIDPDKIKQVFVNIIINACEAMENGGNLNISTKQEGKWVKIYFEDTGIGMEEAHIQNIFNPYYTTKPKGTGLGLTISNGIIELHGGYIEVSSKKEKGSLFTVVLPSSVRKGEVIE